MSFSSDNSSIYESFFNHVNSVFDQGFGIQQGPYWFEQQVQQSQVDFSNSFYDAPSTPQNYWTTESQSISPINYQGSQHIYEIHENFRVPSAHRQSRIVAIETRNEKMGVFYVNLPDLALLSPGLVEGLGRILKSRNGPEYGIGEIGAGVLEFEMILSLIFNCYQGKERKVILGHNMFRVLILAGRFRILSLISECKQHVFQADYSTLTYKTVKTWFDGFKMSGSADVNNQVCSFLSVQLQQLQNRNQATRSMKNETINPKSALDLNIDPLAIKQIREKKPQQTANPQKVLLQLKPKKC